MSGPQLHERCLRPDLWQHLEYDTPSASARSTALPSASAHKSWPVAHHVVHLCAGLQFTGRDVASTVITFAQKTLKDGQVVSKLHVIELGGAGGAVKRNAELFFPAEFADDFPVSLQVGAPAVAVTGLAAVCCCLAVPNSV